MQYHNAQKCSYEVSGTVVRFECNFSYLDAFSKNPQVSNNMTIWSVGDQLHDTDGQTDMTKLLATCRKLQTRLKHDSYESLYHAAVSKPPPHVTCYFQIFSPAHYSIPKNSYTVVYSIRLTGNKTSLTIN